MKPGSDSRAAAGPLLIPTRDEVLCIFDAMYGRTDPVALALKAKCVRVLDSDPRWREPLK